MKEIDEILARRVLVGLGILMEVKDLSDGEAVAELTTEDIAQYDMLRTEVAEIRSLEKMIKELKIKLNTKIIVNNAHRDMWWNNMQECYGITKTQAIKGLHVDYTSKTLRQGIPATDYSNCL